MSRTIKVLNNLADKSQQTYLNSATVVGGTTFPVANLNGANASWAIQIGNTGNETSEILVLGTATPSGTALNTTGTALFNHPEDTPLYHIKYDKIIFKRSTSGTSGVATAITNGTISITPDSDYTVFDDTSGESSYAYKVAFYNSVLGTATDDSDWLTPSGYSFYSLAKLRNRTKNKLFSIKYLKDEDDLLTDWANEWLERMTNTAIDVNQDYSIGTVDIAHGTDGFATVSTQVSNFKEIRKVLYTTNGSDYYMASRMDINDFQPDQDFSESHPYFYYRGDDVISKKPEGQAGTARITYYKTSSVLVNDTDEIPVSMRNYTKSFVDYMTSQAYYLDGNAALGDRLLASAERDLESFRSEITPRAKTGADYIDLVEPTSADGQYPLDYINL